MSTDCPIVGRLRINVVEKISPFEKGERYPDFKPISPDTVLPPSKRAEAGAGKRAQKQKGRRGRFFTRTIP